jgi:succinate dehydrogenase / fumarate reductase cytochrome b subunit
MGLMAASWHLAYGVWLFAAKWGIVSGEKAQQRFLRVCLGFFLVMSGVGVASLYTFRARFPQPTASGNIVDSSQGTDNHGRPVD